MYYLTISGRNEVCSPSAKKMHSFAYTRSRDEHNDDSISLYLDYVNYLLLQYPKKDRKNVSEMTAGFQQAINEIDDLDMDDKDVGFNLLYKNVFNMPGIQEMKSQPVALALAKYFLENFQYLPKPAVPLILTLTENYKPSNNLTKGKYMRTEKSHAGQNLNIGSPFKTKSQAKQEVTIVNNS